MCVLWCLGDAPCIRPVLLLTISRGLGELRLVVMPLLVALSVGIV